MSWRVILRPEIRRALAVAAPKEGLKIESQPPAADALATFSTHSLSRRLRSPRVGTIRWATTTLLDHISRFQMSNIET